MKKLKSFPVSAVKDVQNFYHKAFEAKVMTLPASTTSYVYTYAKYYTPHYLLNLDFIRGKDGHWFINPVELKRLRNWVLKGAQKGTGHVTKLYQHWQKDWQEYIKRTQRLLNLDLAKLSDLELYHEFAHFYDNYLRIGSVAYLADCFMSTGETDWLQELIRKEVGDQKMVKLLLSSPYLSFTLQEEQDLAKITSPKKLAQHQQKYYWIHNNYYHVEYLDVDFFAKRLKTVKATAKAERGSQSKRRRALTRVSQFLRNVIEVADLFTLWKDIRKSGVYIGMEHFDRFLVEMARRRKIAKTDLTFLIFYEVEDFFLKGKDFSKIIKDRKKQTFFAITPKGYFITEGKKADLYFKYLDAKATVDLKQLKGVSASPGFAKGRVRVVITKAQMSDFKQDEILVANQTTPDYVPIMKKAGAIVTEQGGLTSHAAVVSRELKKPCVIGTKIVTQVLKDGDLVEVDATRGVVRKI